MVRVKRHYVPKAKMDEWKETEFEPLREVRSVLRECRWQWWTACVRAPRSHVID